MPEQGKPYYHDNMPWPDTTHAIFAKERAALEPLIEGGSVGLSDIEIESMYEGEISEAEVKPPPPELLPPPPKAPLLLRGETEADAWRRVGVSVAPEPEAAKAE